MIFLAVLSALEVFIVELLALLLLHEGSLAFMQVGRGLLAAVLASLLIEAQSVTIIEIDASLVNFHEFENVEAGVRVGLQVLLVLLVKCRDLFVFLASNHLRCFEIIIFIRSITTIYNKLL